MNQTAPSGLSWQRYGTIETFARAGPASWLAVCKTLAILAISRIPLEVVDISIYTRKGSWVRVDGCSEPLTA